MTETARKKAYRALLRAETMGEHKHFPRVWVVGEHVFFAYHAAVAQKVYDEDILGIPCEEIEEVTYKEASERDSYMHLDWRDEVDWNIERVRVVEHGDSYSMVAIKNPNAMQRPMYRN